MQTRIGPTGRIIKGHVLDVSEKPLQRALRVLDSRLYAKWNPLKLNGWGTWEVRIRPTKMNIVESAEFEGATYFVLGWEENEFDNHIFDVPYLNYGILTRLKAIDFWEHPELMDIDYNDAKYAEKREAKERQELRYNLKQYKKFFKEYQEMVLSGRNPSDIIRFMK